VLEATHIKQSQGGKFLGKSKVGEPGKAFGYCRVRRGGRKMLGGGGGTNAASSIEESRKCGGEKVNSW